MSKGLKLKMIKIPAHSLVLLLLLASSLGSGLSYEDGKVYTKGYNEVPLGICKDRFDIGLGKTTCSTEACNTICVSKNYKKLYSRRCLSSITCECAYRCKRN